MVKCLTALPRACELFLKPKLRPFDGLLVMLAWSSVILLSSKLEFLLLSLKIPEWAREGFFSDCNCYGDNILMAGKDFETAYLGVSIFDSLNFYTYSITFVYLFIDFN